MRLTADWFSGGVSSSLISNLSMSFVNCTIIREASSGVTRFVVARMLSDICEMP